MQFSRSSTSVLALTIGSLILPGCEKRSTQLTSGQDAGSAKNSNIQLLAHSDQMRKSTLKLLQDIGATNPAVLTALGADLPINSPLRALLSLPTNGYFGVSREQYSGENHTTEERLIGIHDATGKPLWLIHFEIKPNFQVRNVCDPLDIQKSAGFLESLRGILPDRSAALRLFSQSALSNAQFDGERALVISKLRSILVPSYTGPLQCRANAPSGSNRGTGYLIISAPDPRSSENSEKALPIEIVSLTFAPQETPLSAVGLATPKGYALSKVNLRLGWMLFSE